MEPVSTRGQAVPALRPVLRPGGSSWRRPEVPPERRPWALEDLDPEQLAREAIAEIKAAIAGLETVLELLSSPKPRSRDRKGAEK